MSIPGAKDEREHCLALHTPFLRFWELRLSLFLRGCPSTSDFPIQLFGFTVLCTTFFTSLDSFKQCLSSLRCSRLCRHFIPDDDGTRTISWASHWVFGFDLFT
ncbi:hypothetical protein BDY19DRAFT_998185 [Irpex rosettiformis]|uniref:Uncharacterized protein n=1 Tax=Irpex rosettiformis TaxID=378272 RepID=A0ACB8TPG9_9APHY|nr:hypothetical protein BDY19DRAFT_998185 [Irpex rosettiformis]